MKNLTILLILFPIWLNAQNISVASFKLLERDLEARVVSPKKDQNGEKCAILKIVTTEQGFVFEGDMNGIVTTQYKTGEYWVYLPWGSKKITIKHAQLGVLRNYIYPIPIKEATVYEMVLTTGKVVTTVVNNEIPMQWLTITSTPDGADVFIDNKLVGTTPFSKKMQIGKYNYRIEQTMYHNSVGAVILTEEKKEALDLTLQPNFGYAKITTTPEAGAKIEIDRKPVNSITPLTTDRLLSGKHTVRVKKAMYSTKTVDFKITDGQTTNLTIPLQPNFATITIQTTPSAAIYIDDEQKGTGTYTGRVMPGLHSIQAKKDKYSPDKKQMEFTAGETKTISLHLLAKTGTADIISTPFNAIIKIDGKEYGTTPNTIKNLLIGNYTLTLTKKGYGTVNKTITIAENQTITVNETLPSGKPITINETLPSGKLITINSTPQGAVIYIDGTAQGTTPYTETLSFTDHAIKLINGKKTVGQIITISQNGKSSWSFDVSENTGTFTDKRDGEIYKTIKIGNQTWMAENLRYAQGKYITSKSEWDNLESNNYDAAYCWYDNSTSNKQKYGALYTYAAAKKACPTGWHLPTDNEWKTLEIYLGMSQSDADEIGWRASGRVGKKLKSKSGWHKNGNGTDDYGFSAFPGGSRYHYGNFFSLGNYGYWWSVTEGNSRTAYYRRLHYDDNEVGRYDRGKSYGYSVRCLRD